MVFVAWRLVVQSPAQILLDLGDVDWVEVHLVGTGPLRILRGHAPLVAETTAGVLYYGTASGEHSLKLEAGLLSITRGQVTVFTTQGQSLPDTPREEEGDLLRV